MGQVQCYGLCTETPESCIEKSNEKYIYTWYDPKPDECCGTCNRTESNLKRNFILYFKAKFFILFNNN